ncbi:hypothetical protein VT99_14241, partial [Candidatus Electrothrix marina]
LRCGVIFMPYLCIVVAGAVGAIPCVRPECLYSIKIYALPSGRGGSFSNPEARTKAPGNDEIL